MAEVHRPRPSLSPRRRRGGRRPGGQARRQDSQAPGQAIAALPRRLKEIFLLHDVQGFKHEEIARTLGLSVGTSKSQLFKARLKMGSTPARI
jgi:DNA-directed RNA polymerase specialized sigma24 family protein